MKIFLIATLLFSSAHVRANCELLSWRFHTIAVYEPPSSLGLAFSSVQNREGGLLFFSDRKDELEKKKYLQKLDGKYGIVNLGTKSFSLESALVKNYKSVRGEITYLKTKEFIQGTPSETIAILDPKLKTISLAGEKYLPHALVAKKVTDNLPPNLVKVFKSTISSKDFSIVSDIADYSKAQSGEWTTQKLGEGDWELVQVKAKLALADPISWTGRYGNEKETTKIKTVYSWLAFLTNNGKDFWYIGNSSGDPCGTDLKSSIQGEVKDQSATIGNQLIPNYGFRLSDSKKSLIYSFGDADIVYYLNFGKDMIVISKESYR